ncbi:hypothetical protein HPC49_11425 [Pyxidicoccus fallax]|uniref:Uncharacterized protein n=1 Tax=Pyxidicoccus fallax TaxID=394095 RepID=A0A848LED2_9BACT|nr:hypothetical protein [Pyxidicoccus fallax]NMO17067.1 hypothetical protein [Pyxidicoccus fallax]NPC78849.1 hypothetical protein [Pyxidicoccus fallax]
MLAPFLTCASPADFVALQRTVDMPRLVESLSDWDAVKLGALGPLDAKSSEVLGRKRAAFIVAATEKYGVPFAEVFALFILHSAYDDEVREVVRLLARRKQLGETLGRMATVREELEARGLKLADIPERDARAGDVLRGLGRAGRDALATVPVLAEGRYTDFHAKRMQLPPAYREALHEVERALVAERFSTGSAALGSFDSLTFGVPLGCYHLLAGTLQGVGSLTAGEYEQATRELAPAALLVGLYAGGRGARYVREGSIAGREGTRLPSLAPRLEALKGVVARLEARLGRGSIGELARHLQASRDGALVVAEWGEAGAVALHETRGNAGKAQAWLSEAKSQRAGPTLSRGGAGKGPGLAAQVSEAAGYTREAVETKLRRAEWEAPGARLPADVALLKRQSPALDAPPPGVREGSALWGEYVTYRARRLAEVEQGQATKGPLRWEGYREMRGLFARGLDFERAMVDQLRADAVLPRAQRRWLTDFEVPRIETHVGVWKPKTGLRYTDVLVIEERPPAGQPPLVETFSFKSRDLHRLEPGSMASQVVSDASAALNYYGQTLNIRRRSLNPEGDMVQVQVQRVRLVYEGGDLRPGSAVWNEALNVVRREVQGVEVLVR